MKVKVTSRTAGGAWVGRVESLFPDTCAEKRKAMFLDACDKGGLSRENRVVRVLMEDLQFIRPEDVWFRVLSGEQENGFYNGAEQRLDAALAALRIVSAYADRRTAAPELVEKLVDVPATIVCRPGGAIDEWRHFQLERLADWNSCSDEAITNGHSSRFTPLAVSTVVCAIEYHTAEPVVRATQQFAALESISRELFAWARGDVRRRGFATRWLKHPPTDSEFYSAISIANESAEELLRQWHEAKPYVGTAWAALLEDQVWDAIRFAAIASSAAEMKAR
ncbi:hypothetical protein PV772_19720 [Pseudarthrobacter sp. CC12]|uniref:hypothetical protein n=1 Tax=Pseudarthrobacter sp. CC12 TaxID=3029193 RepID=UPI003267B97D